MVKNNFSKGWNRSIQPRKQRKYRYNVPLHLKQSMLGVHLSADLRKKYGKRTIRVRKGDKVRILRGQFKRKEGKVERVDVKKEKVFVTGIEIVKKEGAKILHPLVPSNLMIIEMNLDDKKRKQKLEKKDVADKKETKSTENKQEKK